MDVGLSRDGCIPRWDVGEPSGEEVTWPDESVWINGKKRGNQNEIVSHFITFPAIISSSYEYFVSMFLIAAATPDAP